MGTGKLIVYAILVAVIARVVQFIMDSGELMRLRGVNYKNKCENVLSEHIGFEDLAKFETGDFITFSSNHSHFKFAFGKSMRQMLKEKLSSKILEEIYPVIVKADGNIAKHPLRVENIPENFEFYPHGVAALGGLGKNEKEMPLVLVVNHRSDVDALEIFHVRSNDESDYTLVHEKSVLHPLLFNVNDCVFVDRNNVYCTNWRSNPTGSLMDAIEVYGQMPWNNVVHCNLETSGCEVVAEGIRMANGIEISKDGLNVFVVATMDKAVLVYARNNKDNSLDKVASIPTNALCDNLVWDGEALLSGCHPKALTFVAYSTDPHNKVAPCEVIEIPILRLGGKYISHRSIKTRYLDPVGDEFPACAVAAVTQGKTKQLWIGGVHAKGMLRCPVDPTEIIKFSSEQRYLRFFNPSRIRKLDKFWKNFKQEAGDVYEVIHTSVLILWRLLQKYTVGL